MDAASWCVKQERCFLGALAGVVKATGPGLSEALCSAMDPGPVAACAFFHKHYLFLATDTSKPV